MAAIPPFETVAIVGDKPGLVAEIASLFTRPRRYLPVIDGPRMARPDWENEVIRRSNALLMTQSRRVVLADLPVNETQHLSRDWPDGTFVSVNSADEAATALKGCVSAPRGGMAWGNDNLGVGLLLARRSKKILQTAERVSPTTRFVSGGRHLLIACEVGHELAQIAASNLAFAMDAAFLVLPQLAKEEQDEWLEEIYAISSGGDASSRFVAICDQVRRRLPDFDFEKYKQALFVTNGFPWGIAVPECATTHMFSYPDLGRSIVEGIWASRDSSRSSRTALLIDPQQIAGSEIESIAEWLGKNKTLSRIEAGPRATVNKVQMLVETVPFDIIVLATHAGDVSGERVTYEFKDSEGLPRRLVIDEAVSFSYDSRTDKYLVQLHERFHELDGVNWKDSAAKKKLYVGTAMRSWEDLGNIEEKGKFKVHSEKIARVIGSMGLQMHDDTWFPMIHGFSHSCSPVVINNACSSWHELSKRFTFAGARAYIGTLFPVVGAEAQEVGIRIFHQKIGMSLPTALWASQNAVYKGQCRRPYAMVGLPFCSILPNTIDPVAYLVKEYKNAIAEYRRMEETSPFPDIKENSRRFKEFLYEDLQAFVLRFRLQSRKI